MQPPVASTLPTAADIHKLVTKLRDDLTPAARAEVADRLVSLGADEPHPAVKAALLERAARLVSAFDADRALGLLRESFRQQPTTTAGSRLRDLAQSDGSFARLNRLGHLADAVAEIAAQDERAAMLLDAARSHVGQGHGQAALQTLARVRELLPEELPEREEVEQLHGAATAQVQARQEVLAEQRQRIVEAPDGARPQLLLDYAVLLISGEEPLGDAAAVLADAIDSGAPLHEAGPLWVEVARAMGDARELTRALWATLQASEDLPLRLQLADELANLLGVEDESPEAAAAALDVLYAALPDDQVLRSRLEVARALAQGNDPVAGRTTTKADAALDELRVRCLRDRDRAGESVACLALAQRAQRRNDLESAERHYRRVRTLTPNSPEALDFFESYYRNAGDSKRLFVALTQRLTTADGRELVRIALEIAQLASGPLATPERAIEAYHRVIQVQPDHPVANQALEQLYRDQKRWPAVRDLLDRCGRSLAARAGVDPSVVPKAVAVLERLAALHEDPQILPSDELALHAWRDVVGLDPAHPKALEAVVKAALAAGDKATAADRLARAAQATDDTGRKADLWLRAGDLLADELDDLSGAATAWRAALVARPSDSHAAKRLQDVARHTHDDAALLDALTGDLAATWGEAVFAIAPEDAAARTPADRRPQLVATLEEAAALCEAVGRPVPQSVALYRLLVTLQPGHPVAIAGLERLLTELGDLSALADVVDAQASLEAVASERRVALLETLAGLCSGPLADFARAESVADRLRQLDPDSPVARTVASRVAVERGDLLALRALYPQSPEGATRFADAALNDAVERTGVRQVQMMQAVAEALAREAGDADRAAMVLGDALSLAEALPANPERTALLVAVSEELLLRAQAARLVGLQRIAVEVLAQHAPAESQLRYRQMRVDLCETAGLYADAASAAADLVDDLVAAGSHGQVLAAARRCDELCALAPPDPALASRFAAWAEILAGERKPGDSTLDEALVFLWRRAAERALHGGDLDVARLTVDAAVAIKPHETDLLDLRERIGVDQGDWAVVADALETRAGLATGDERLDLLLRAAEACDVSVGDPARAEKLYRAVLAERPESAEAWVGLVATVRQSGDKRALADALDGFLQRSEGGREARARAALERVELAAEAGDDAMPAALSVLRHLATATEVLEVEETLLGVALVRLDVAGENRAVAEALLSVVQQHGRVDETALCLAVLATTEANASAAADWWLRQADVLRDRDAGQAYTALRQATALSGGRADVVQKLGDQAQAAGQTDDFDLVLLGLLGEAELDGVAPVADAEARHRIAILRAGRATAAGDAETAIRLFLLLHEAAPKDLEPLDALEGLQREAGDLDALAWVLEARLASVVDDDDDKVSTYLRLADLHESERRAPGEAVEVLARAVAELPNRGELQGAWLEALRRSGDKARLGAELLREIERLGATGDRDDLAQRAALRREAAGVLDGLQRDPRRAMSLWLATVEVEPTDAEALAAATDGWLALAADGVDAELADAGDRLALALEVVGEFTRLDAVLGARAAASDGAARRDWLLQQARYREQALAAPAAAFEALTEALQLDPGHVGALEGLDRCARAMGDDRARLGVLQARIAASEDPAATSELRLERARLADAIGDEGIALAAWQELAGNSDVEVRREAAAALCSLHERRDDAGGMGEALLLLQATAEDSETIRELALQAAAAFVRAGKRDRARTVLTTEAARAQPDAAVQQALEDELRAAGDVEALCACAERGWREVWLAPEHAPQRLRAAVDHATAVRERGRPAHELWETVGAMLDAGLRSPELENYVLEVALDADRVLALAAARRRITLLHERNALQDEAAARLELIEGFRDEIDAVGERKAVARLFESLGDLDAALGQWLGLLGDAPPTTAPDAEIVDQLLQLGDELGRTADIEAAVAAAAAGLDKAPDRSSVRMRLVERAYARGEHAAMATQLDALIADDPGHGEAFAMRGAVLAELPEPERRAREPDHWRHGLQHLPDAADRALMAVRLADRALHDHDPALARQLAERALNESGADVGGGGDARREATAVLEAVADAALSLDGPLALRLADLLCNDHPDRAAKLLQRAVTVAAAGAERVELLRRLTGLLDAARQKGAVVDEVIAWRDLALAEPRVAAHWDQLQAVTLREAHRTTAPRTATVVDALMTAADAGDDAGFRCDLLHRAGRIAEQAGDLDTATTCLRLALEADERPELHAALDALLARQGRDEELALELESQAEKGPAHALDLRLRAARLWLGGLQDLERGVALVGQGIAGANDTDPEALARRVLDLTADPDVLRQLLPTVTPLLAGRDGALVAGAVFDVGGERLGDDDALEPFARAAWDGGRLDAALWLEARLDRRGDQIALADAIQQRIDRTQQDDPDAALSARMQLAELCLQRLGDAARAAAVIDPALVQAPDHEGAQRLRLDTAERLGDADTVSRLCDVLVRGASGADEVDLWLRKACAEQKLGRLDGALEACEVALAGDPENSEAQQLRVTVRERLVASLPADEREAAVRALAQNVARDLHDGTRALDLLMRAARTSKEPLALLAEAGDLAREADLTLDWIEAVADLVSSDELPPDAVVPAVGLVAGAAAEAGDTDRATDLWELAWNQDPDSSDARAAVLAFRRDAGDPQRLVGALERALVLAPGDECHAIRLELAELKSVSKPREAVRHVLDALAARPDDVKALELAESLAQNPACADAALACLEPVYRAGRNWPQLAGVLERRLQRSTGPIRAEFARELAALQADKLTSAPGALRSLLSALEVDPRPPSLEAVERVVQANPGVIGNGNGQVPSGQVAAAFARVLAGRLPPDQRAPILQRAAAFALAQGDGTAAEGHLRALVELRPEAQQPFEQLEAMLDGAGRFDELLNVLQDRLSRLGDPDLQRMTLHRMAGLARALDKIDLATAAYRGLCELAPDDPDAHEALVEMLRETADKGTLAATLIGLAGAVQEGARKASVLCEAGRLYAGRILHDDGKAHGVYAQAFAADPACDEAFVYLERHATGDARALHPLYSARVVALPPGPTRTLIQRRLAHACVELGDGPGAVAALEQALDDDPGNTAVLDELLRTADQHRLWPNWLAAAELKRKGDLPKDARVALLAHIARIRVTDVPDVAAADAALKELQGLAPQDAATRTIQALVQAHSGDPAKAVGGLEQLVKETDDPQSLVSLHQQLADLYAGPLQQPAKAKRELQRLISLDPKRWSARRRLCDLYRATSAPEAHAECLRQWLATLGDTMQKQTLQLGQGETLAELLIELGEVLVGTGQISEAAETLDKAAVFGGPSVRLNPLLAQAREAAGDIPGAIDAIEWLLQHHAGRDRDLVARYGSRLGALHEATGANDKAREAYKTALEARPTDDDAALGAARTSLAVGDIDRAMRLFDVVARRPGTTVSSRMRADAHVGMGRCRVARLQLDQARACYERALAAVPGYPPALEALKEL
jgi:tetratricopeptide (TPR) repeat protein